MKISYEDALEKINFLIFISKKLKVEDLEADLFIIYLLKNNFSRNKEILGLSFCKEFKNKLP